MAAVLTIVSAAPSRDDPLFAIQPAGAAKFNKEVEQ